MINPLFSNNQEDDEQKPKDTGYVLKQRHSRTIEPLSKHHPAHVSVPKPRAPYPVSGNMSAVELIRRKVESLYGEEPDIREEMTEAARPAPHPSKHQQFMYKLSTSGKPLAQVQTEWHNYYTQLPANEKHEVWREFYETHARQPSAYGAGAHQPVHPAVAIQGEKSHGRVVVAEHGSHLPAKPVSKRRAIAHIKKRVLNRVLSNNEAQLKAKQHIRSLAFGLTTGVLVLLVLMFSFFNEMFIAPFIQPSRHVSATPIIVNADSIAPNATPEVIIPKINVQIPVVYDEPSADEAAIQRALERGVIHYPSTALPGQQGNAALFGHSSNNIFNKGQYKFAFVLLRQLLPGDIFYLTYDSKIYTYRVFDKKIVPPTEVTVLNAVSDKTATAALITCDPPGTSTNRLVVWGEQISPDPVGATSPQTPPAPNSNTAPTELPSEGPTMWNRFWNWLF